MKVFVFENQEIEGQKENTQDRFKVGREESSVLKTSSKKKERKIVYSRQVVVVGVVGHNPVMLQHE